MPKDIRLVLQEADCPSNEIDKSITIELGKLKPAKPPILRNYSTDYTTTIRYIESCGYDWIMANVNGNMGGTPFGCVGVPEDKASFSATPLLSLWLSFFRFELGDERQEDDET